MVLPSAGGYPVPMVDIFSVVADSSRRDILFLLLERSRNSQPSASGTDVAAELGLSPHGVSAHLKVLVDNGFVVVSGEGSGRTFSLDVEPLQELAEWVLPFLGLDTDVDASAEGADGLAVGATDAPGATVFAAWSGADAGDSLGRAISDRSHGVRVALETAAAKVATVLPETITKRLSDRP